MPYRIVCKGEMADLTRRFHWETTSLGPIESWPDELITTVNLLLASSFPMFLWWGPDLIQFYNDSYRPSIREDKHPSALGQRGEECWQEAWAIIGPDIETVVAKGESIWNVNRLVPIFRHGRIEEVFWTYSYSPVRDREGRVEGVLVVCNDTTVQVLNERRLRTLLTIEKEVFKAQSLDELANQLVHTLDNNPADIPFAALYRVENTKIRLVGETGLESRVQDATKVPPLQTAADMGHRCGTRQESLRTNLARFRRRYRPHSRARTKTRANDKNNTAAEGGHRFPP